jgi:hypothetical protein
MSKAKAKNKLSSRPAVMRAEQAPSRVAIIAGYIAVAIALMLAVVLRFWASFDQFWLDEIWSWMMAIQLRSPVEIITRLHHDNNHHLNTLVLYLFGKDAPFYLYRLPAVLAGIGTVLLCGWVARAWSRPAAVAATLLTGCSFLLIEYSSEARGYAYLMFFTMASFAAMQASLDRPRAIWDVLFGGCAVLGFLSHLTYLFAYVALVAWSVWRRVHRDGWLSSRHAVPFLFQILIPSGFLVFLYFIDLRHLQIGGGDAIPIWTVIAQAISVAFGGPLGGAATVAVALAVSFVGVLALVLLYRTGSDLWVPMLTGILIVPVVVEVVTRPRSPYPRYFLVSMLLLQLLISWFLGWLWRWRAGKVVCVLALAIMLGGNAVLTARLLQYGRGDYEAAVRYMLEQTVGDRVTIASDHDFRNKTVLAFYLARIGDGGRAGYYDYGNWPPEGPEWVVLHNFDQHFSPASGIKDDHGNTYEFVRVFPYAGLSGFNWALYHNANRPTKSPLTAQSQLGDESAAHR